MIIGFMLVFISCQKREKIYHENGKLKELFEVNSANEKHGKYQQYYESGQLLESAEYKNGLLEGKRLFYYENGQVEEIQKFEKGNLNGEQLGYHENGVLKFKCTNKDNLLVGEYFSYYDNGNKRLYLNFVDDLENGPFEEYYRTGIVKWKGTYRNGNKEYGLLENFDESGTLIKKMNCDTLGICVTIWKKEEGTE
jgi:antitoxin component YwqK of YwqJK toxin-antitoxin module